MNDPTLTKYERERRAVELMRAAIFAWYGETCACCDTAEDLGVDHVDGDGPEQRAAALGQPGRTGYNPAGLYRWIIEHGFPDGFQTMCRPCNSSKGTGDRCRLNHADRAGQRRERNAAAQAAWRERHGVSVSVPPGLPADVLRYLGEHGPSRSGAIARGAGVRPGVASACLAALLKAGQVENPAYGVYRLPGQAGDLPGVGFGSRAARRRSTVKSAGADAQALWRERHGTSRFVSTNPDTAGGRIITYLRENGPSHVDAIAAGAGLSYWSVAANVAGLLRAGHVERHTRMDGEFERQAKGVYRLPARSDPSDELW
jgi:DNA-binding MarR family transcriptional regulator